MSAPQIPLRDLHLPEPVSWWPPAPGWWFLAAMLLLGLVWLIVAYFKHRAFTKARRHALKRLDAYSQEYVRHGDPVLLGKQLSELVRRTMLAYAPRRNVAGLTGEAWLEWLDRDLDRSHFVEGDGRPLIDWPYRGAELAVDRSDVGAFVDVVRLRLRTPVKT